MYIPPLIPSVKRSTWRCHDENSELADEEYRAIRMSVLKRDRFSCVFCGFISKPNRHAEDSTLEASGYLEVHHIDDDHTNNKKENLLTACPFCHQVFHCGNAGYREAATAIYLPEVSQADLNLFANLLTISILRGGEYRDAAIAMQVLLLSNTDLAQRLYGEGICDCKTLGAVLMGLHQRSPRAYKDRAKLLYGIRLYPNASAYPKAIKYWSDEAWLPESQFNGVLSNWQTQFSKT